MTEPVRSRWWPVVWIGAITMAIEAAVYAGVGVTGASSRTAALATMAVATVWIALAVPIFAAGGRGAFDRFIRGGTVIDATGAILCILWMLCPQLGLLSALKIYAVLASMGLAGIVAVCAARSDRWQAIVAVMAAVVMVVALTTPFWGNGILVGLDGSARQGAATGMVAVNPVFSMAAASARDLHWVWNEAPRMYRTTVLGQIMPVPSVSWYVTPLIWLGLAGIAAVVALWRHGGATPAAPTDLPATP